MKDVEELLKQAVKQSKDKDAHYIYGVEHSSDTDPDYKALIRFSKEGAIPVVFGGKNKRQLKKEIKKYIAGEDAKDITVRFHQYQIDLAQKSVRFHQDCIKDYEDNNTELRAE